MAARRGRCVSDGSDRVECGARVELAKPVVVTGVAVTEAGPDEPGEAGLPIEWGGVRLSLTLFGEDGQPVRLRRPNGGAFRVVG